MGAVSSPDFLVIVHVTKDLFPESQAIGGTATYSALTAKALGRRVGVITSAAPDYDPEGALQGIEIICVPSPCTTTFRNIYLDGERRQFILAQALPIEAESVPLAWRQAVIVHLGPVAQEVDIELARLFPHSLKGLTPQGLLRRWDERGQVSIGAREGLEEFFSSIDVLIFSREDVAGDVRLVEKFSQLSPICVLTQGREGATVFQRNGGRHFPAQLAKVVDPTGAGDVFAASYLVKLAEDGDPYQAARFANCAASLVIQQPGIAGIPTREEIERRLIEKS